MGDRMNDLCLLIVHWNVTLPKGYIEEAASCVAIFYALNSLLYFLGDW